VFDTGIGLVISLKRTQIMMFWRSHISATVITVTPSYFLLRKLKHNYQKSLLASAKNNKEKWNAIKSITNCSPQKTSALSLLSANNADGDIKEINNYFASIGENLANNIIQLNNNFPIQNANIRSNNCNSFVLLSPDEAEVESLIDGLRTNSATGWDSIPAKLLKFAKRTLVPPLTKLFSCALCKVFSQKHLNNQSLRLFARVGIGEL
jgi:hypothetical protein